MGLLDSIRRGDYVAEKVAVGPSPGERRQSLAETAKRVAGGEDLMPVVRDFLDQIPRLTADELALLITERPPLTGRPEADALIGGIAEHVAATRQVSCPAWVREPERFLERFWFVSGTKGFRAIALAQAPMALKRRGVFWPARSMERV